MKKILFQTGVLFFISISLTIFSSNGPLDEISLDSPVRKNTLLEELEDQDTHQKLSVFRVMLQKIKKPFCCFCVPKKIEQDSDFHDL